jgi:hypothetical protein
MAKTRAFIRYLKGKLVPGSLIFTSGEYPKAPFSSGKWQELPYDLCCEPFQQNYTCCIAIQSIADSETGEYGFSLECRDNGGPNLTGTIHWTSTQSETFSVPPDDTFDFFYAYNDQLPHTVYLCIDNPAQLQDFEIGFGPGTATSISNLQKLEGFDEWDGDDMAFTSLDFTGITTITQLFNVSTGLQHINITGCVNLDDVDLNNNALTEASVDHILITLDDNGLTDGFLYLDGGTNATPSATGLAAIANLLVKNWSINYNP